GGMGVVYRAFDERLQREVAVKEIPGADSDRVLREAKAAARLNHPAIATLYEFGADDGDAILVSELAGGAPLGELAAAGELTDRDIAEAGLDVCAAIADCLRADPGERPGTLELADVLAHVLGGLDSERLLAGASGTAERRPRQGGRGLRIAVTLALAAGLWALAGPAGKPGLALVVGVLAVPGFLLASSLEQAFVPLLAPLLGAVSLGLAYPALAGRRGGGRERALLGAL